MNLSRGFLGFLTMRNATAGTSMLTLQHTTKKKKQLSSYILLLVLHSVSGNFKLVLGFLTMRNSTSADTMLTVLLIPSPGLP
jgi:hypothetical protein